MSGVEVLGLVLGAIPLLVSAFEHFRDACIARDLMLDFETSYGHILRQVKDEQLFFRLHLRKLLLPLIQDGCDIDDLLLDSGNLRCNDQRVDQLLERRLTDGHERYIELLESISTILHKLLTTLKYTQNPFQERLAALKEAEAAHGLTARMKLRLKANVRLRGRHLDYVVTKWNRDALIEELRESRKKLEKILDGNTEIAIMQGFGAMNIPAGAVQSLLQHWQHANRVYDLIFKTCSCRRSHCANLWLQHHESATFELKLLVFFSPVASLPRPCPWQQQGLRIQSIEHSPESDRKTMQVAIANTKINHVSSTTAVSTTHAEPKKGIPSTKRTKYHLKPTLRLTGCPSTSYKQADKELERECNSKKACFFSEKPSATDSQRIEEIQNLCKALADCGMESICIGALTAREDSHSYRYKVSSQPEQKIIADEIALFDVLQPSHRPRLPRADRMKIALKIASSHLKLHSTPWIRRQWEARNIKFPCTRYGSRTNILTDRPFISTDFAEDSIRPSSPSSASSPAPSSGDEFDPSTKSFVCLGIMLLELQFGYLLEEHDLWQQVGPDKKSYPLLRLMVASRWALAAEGEAGRDFAQIVQWCLNESPATLQDEGWRRDLANRVVLPLQKCCEWVAV